MAIALTARAGAGSTTDGTSVATASFTPTANTPLLAVYQAHRTDSTAPTDPSVSGHATWTQIDALTWATAGTNRRRLWIFAGDPGGSPGASAITFSHGATTHHAFQWSVFELSGTDYPTTTLANLFVQIVKTTVETTGTATGDITLAAAGAADNRAFLAMGCGAVASEAITERTNWTEIHEAAADTPSANLQTSWRSDAFETTASASWTSSVKFGAMAFEIKALVSSTPLSFAVGQIPVGF